MAEYIDKQAFLEEQRHLYCENCGKRKGMKRGKMQFVYEIGDAPCRACGYGDVLDDLEDFPAADVRPVPEGGIGEMSDGYHTFNGLYYQRMILFAALVKAYKDKSWKSWKHEDGELCFGGGWFVVGIDTPEGSYTYHYEGKDWDRFDCVALPEAKHWDGHTEEDVTRLFSLDARPVVKAAWEDTPNPQWPAYDIRHCPCCGWSIPKSKLRVKDLNWNFCPNCGAMMEES